MIRFCTDEDFDAIWEIINDAAGAYKGIIPPDCWHEPYMSRNQLRDEVAAGVRFWGLVEGSCLQGVMGIQDVQDVTLIRHAYVRTSSRRGGVGGQLLSYLQGLTDRLILIGTWTAADWAIRFYEKHGYQVVPMEMKDHLLQRYWTVSPRQIETSVVLFKGKLPEFKASGSDAHPTS